MSLSGAIVGAVIGLAIIVLRAMRYRTHVPHPELQERWKKLPDPRQVGKRSAA